MARFNLVAVLMLVAMGFVACVQNNEDDGSDLCKEVEYINDHHLGTWNFVYDQQGKETQREWKGGELWDIQNGDVRQSEYDENGNEVYQAWMRADGSVYQEVMTEYDTSNRQLVEYHYREGEWKAVWTWTYQGENLVQKYGKFASGRSDTSTYTYYSDGQMESYRWLLIGDDHVQDRLQVYKYDSAGRKVEECEAYLEDDPDAPCYKTVWVYEGELIKEELHYESDGSTLSRWTTHHYDDRGREILLQKGYYPDTYEAKDPDFWTIIEYKELETSEVEWSKDGISHSSHKFFDEQGRTVRSSEETSLFGGYFTEVTHEYDDLGREVVYTYRHIDHDGEYTERETKSYGNCRE